ncbi:MAG: hypothetical protein ACK45H_05060, partial [Bacteroidota bacterium]
MIKLTFLFYLMFFLSLRAQVITVQTINTTKDTRDFVFPESTNKNPSVFFFLPTDTYDSLSWSVTLNNFLDESALKELTSLSFVKVFFDPGDCGNCGLKIKNDEDSIVPIYFPTCFISGHDTILARRAIKKVLGFSLNTISKSKNISQITYQSNAACINKPSLDSDFLTWKPFLEEVFCPNYSKDEKIEQLWNNNLLLKKEIDELKKLTSELQKKV